MLFGDQKIQSIWYEAETDAVKIIDQTRLPHQFEILTLDSLEAACHAISAMQVRGAPLIGVTAAYGVYLAMGEQPAELEAALAALTATRPTAVNLAWALQRCREALTGVAPDRRAAVALELAQALEQEDLAIGEAIGEHGARLLSDLWEQKRGRQSRLQILTHCNAGALATVGWGTALAVIYKASASGVPLHVWVGETRPRNQGAALTCWELQQQGIAHTLIVDNAGGHLMQQGLVDACVVGSDRTASNGDVCNKIGTYQKALAAQDNGIPFYVALPISSIDFSLNDGSQIPIEERAGREITHLEGANTEGLLTRVRITGKEVAVSNPGFDVTPARLVSGIITERGVVAANQTALRALQP